MEIHYKSITNSLFYEQVDDVTMLLYTIIDMPRMNTHEKAIFTYVVAITSKELEIDPYLVYAMAFTESTFNPKAVGRAGEIGLFQVKPTTAHYIYQFLPDSTQEYITGISKSTSKEKINLFDIRVNTIIAMHYVYILKDRYNGNLNLVLGYYNSGYPRPNKYVKKVLNLRQQYMDVAYIENT